MTLLIRKHAVFYAAVSCCAILALYVFLQSLPDNRHLPVFSSMDISSITVVIDPGHGGEDGGAVSADGTGESQLNLEVSLRLNDLLRFIGQRTQMTRTEDISIHTEGDTIRARKASDIRNRVSLVNSTPNAVLLSIHQNSLPSSPVTHGAQVFWNRQEGGEVLANVLQDALNQSINPGNEKHPKPIPATIYLMKHVTAPAALVECGFLSNQAETALLRHPAYQTKLAMAIAAGFLRVLAGEEIP